jgi:hypothetical protein
MEKMGRKNHQPDVLQRLGEVWNGKNSGFSSVGDLDTGGKAKEG